MFSCHSCGNPPNIPLFHSGDILMLISGDGKELHLFTRTVDLMFWNAHELLLQKWWILSDQI